MYQIVSSHARLNAALLALVCWLLGVLLSGCTSGGESGVASCSSVTGCGVQAVCINGACVALCLNDEDCGGATPYCEPVGHQCVGCAEDAHCREDEYCAEGECKPDVCTPGASSCDPQTHGRRTCLTSGGGYELEVCPNRTSCAIDGGEPVCQDWVCTAATNSCDDAHSDLTQCSEDGLQASVTHCKDQNESCVDGACIPTVCDPGRYFCMGEDSFSCAEDGASFTGHAACLPQQYCDEARGECLNDLCSQGGPACDGNVARVCLPDGSGFEPGGTDCALTAETCAFGVCAKVTCVANEQFCDSEQNAVMACDSSGTTSNVYYPCSAQTFCDPDSVTCVPDVCYQGAAACDGETLATCRADGGGISERTVDCSLNGQVCSFDGICVDADLTVIGAKPTSPNDIAETEFMGLNLYQADKDRTLTLIEQHGAATADTVLTWVVVEGTMRNLPMVPVFERVTNGDSASEFQSSGALSFPLIAGHYYWIGVSAMGSMFFDRDSGSALAPLPVSFGTWLGFTVTRLSATETGTGSPYWPFYQRLTTAPPQP